MRLKRIELAGFKSFVDPTKIDLDQGITAIVGPNGCGKSNIVDALRWVLGEHSARHLRGGVMDDLIFQGSDARPPVAICDVELTFAIDKGSLASPYHELDEIRIRRRLTREGGSDAFINGKMVRLKDVVDLFLDTGISTRAYAIVEQGSIARMVTAKPDERRVIFEEAAGVMKYRSRRREAERRMKDTSQNLDRVLDLLEEVRTQCRSLKQQASRAERFKTLQDEFSQMQSISLGLRYWDLQQNYQRIEHQLGDAKTAEAEAAGALATAEKEVAEAREQMVAHENEAQSVQDQLRAAERHRADLQQQAERMAGERRLLSERKAALENRIAEANGQQQRISEEQAGVGRQLQAQDDSALQANKAEAAAAVDAAIANYREQGAARDTLFADFERLRHGNEQAVQQRQKAEQALARLDDREQQLKERMAELAGQLSQKVNGLQESEQALQTAREQKQSSEQALEAAQAKLAECRQMREQAQEELNRQEAALREANGMVHQLRGLMKNEDVPDALRDGLRSRGGTWVDESLHVPEGLEAAAAAALRGRAADVRLPANMGADELAQVLHQASSSAVALFAGGSADSSLQGQSLAVAMGIAPEHPLYDLFAPVRLVDEIGQAGGATEICVSRDGWRREISGWLIPPTGSRTAERLATQRKLREAEAGLSQSETALAEAKRQFEAAEAALEQQQIAWQQAHLAATEHESSLHAAEAALARFQAEVAALTEREQRFESDMQELADERRHWLAQAEQVGEIDQQALTEAEEKLNRQAQVVAEAESGMDLARQQLNQAEQAVALFAQARDNLVRESERLRTESERLEAQLAADRERLDQANAALEAASKQGDLNQELARAVIDVDAAHQSMNEVRTQGHAMQQRQHEVERRERQMRQQLQAASEQRQGIEVQRAQDETRLQDLASEIVQRCQCEPAELVAKIEAMDELEDAEAIMQKARDLEERIARFGPVNLLAIEEFEQASEREGFLAEQAADLEASLSTLNDTINKIDRTMRQRFKEVFDQTNAYFKQTFPQLFGGGRAELRLDSDDILTAGVEVIAQPPGKRLQDVTLLSGGEKALTAVALVFSIFKIKPAPFCVLDEVDAPLDDANVGRFGEMVRELSDRVQFLAISHNKITMQQADRLVGVSMPEPGVSKIVAVDMGNMPH